MIDVWICWIYLHLDFAAIFRETNPPNAIHQNLKVFLVDGLHPTSSVTHSNSPPIYQPTYQPHQPWEILRVFLYNQNCLEKTWKVLGKKKTNKIPASKASFSSSMDDDKLIPQMGWKWCGVFMVVWKVQKWVSECSAFSSQTAFLDPSNLKYCLLKMRWLSDTAQNFTPMYE